MSLVSRLETLLQDAPPGAIVEPVALHLNGQLAEIPHTPKTAVHHLRALDAHNLTYHFPTQTGPRKGSQTSAAPEARRLCRRHGAYWLWQDVAACPVAAAAGQW
ncbi:MAG: hypothetical protein R3E31_09235 [Chloroflexota bacterium]